MRPLSRYQQKEIRLVAFRLVTASKHIFYLTGLCYVLFSSPVDGQAQPSSHNRDSTEIQRVNPPKKIRWIGGGASNVHEFSLWGGHAFDSFDLWGKTPQSTLSLMGIRYNRKLLYIYNNILEYTLDISLYAHYTFPEFTAERRRNSISGGGFSPLGLQLNFATHGRFQPFIKTSGGLMFLSQPFPDIRGEKINFTFGAGGGFEYILTSYASISLGYRFFHLSNGDTGQVNPGIDSSFFYGGITIF